MHRTLQRALAVGTTAALALSALTASAPTASAAAPSLTKAANYLVRNLPTSADGVGTALTTANAFAATGDCTYAPAARTLVSQITKGAKAYLYPGKKLNQARAANLAITVQALGLDVRKFAGYNLLSLVRSGMPVSGQVGSSGSTFNQSLALIAMSRGKADLPIQTLTSLLALQVRTGDDKGAFGYEYPAGTLNADPDSTGMALLALKAVGHLDPQQDAALAWAKGVQQSDGSWPNDYSPVDTTGVLGSAVNALGGTAEAAKAIDWLGTQQLSDGGFPASRDGDDSNVMATANAIWLLAKKTPLDASLNLAKCPKNPTKLPASTTTCTGVWVVVDRGNGDSTTRCATKYGNGIDALKSAGFALGFDPSGYINRIHGFPYTIDTTFSKYWGYYYATPKSDGGWSEWSEYQVGAGDSKPAKGAVEGWLYGPWLNGAQPDLNTPPLGYATTGQPTITGTAKVGQTLTAVPGTWDPEPTFSYRWYRSGSSISGATKSTYKLTKSDAGKTITVKVTGTLAQHQTVARTSAPTAKVSK